MAEYKSERTKKIEKSKVDEDMPMVKKAVRGTALGISRAMDKVEGMFKKKDTEEKEMAKGGYAKKKVAAKKAPVKKAAKGMLVIPVSVEKKKSAPKKRK